MLEDLLGSGSSSGGVFKNMDYKLIEYYTVTIYIIEVYVYVVQEKLL